MKFKITRPDGTVIEGEATAEDVLKLAPAPFQLHWTVPTPIVPVVPIWPPPGPITYEFTC